MKQYLEACQKVMQEGFEKGDRTGTGTISYFGLQMRFNLQAGFPLLTTKKVHFHSIVHELLWFIKGDTNIRYLVDNDVRIWNEWPYEKYRRSLDYQGETIEQFIERIKSDDAFACVYGDLGPVYGKQWRRFGIENFEIDQLKMVINEINNNPNSRRLIVSAWNPLEIEQMALPPCHAFFQFYVQNGKLSCQLYQRSADMFLGVPFNIASYSLLTMMVAHVCHLQVGDFIHTIGDAHIYSNHIEQINKQLSRTPKALPILRFSENIDDIDKFTFDKIILENYHPHKGIRAKVAI